MENNNKGNVVKIIKDVMFVLLMFSAVELSNARSAGSRQGCEPPDPEDENGNGCSYYHCDDTLYYFDKELYMCKECKSCPKGEEPDSINYCDDQRNGIDFKCEPCREGYFSDKESQHGCLPCRECLFMNREVVTECSATTDRICGGCKPGYYLLGDYCEPCALLTRAQKLLKGCPVATPRTTTTKLVSTTALHSTPKQTTVRASTSKEAITTTVPYTTTKGTTITMSSKPLVLREIDGSRKTDEGNLLTPPGIGKPVKELGYLGIILFGIVVILVVVGVFAYCTFRIYVKMRMNSSDSRSGLKHGHTSSFSSTGSTGYSAENSGGSKNSTAKHNEADNELDNFDLVDKKFQEKHECRIEIQQTQMGADGEKQQQQSRSPSTPHVNSPDAPPQINQNLNDLDDKVVPKPNPGKQKCYISTKKPCSSAQNSNDSNENCKQMIDDKRRGEESIQVDETELLLTPKLQNSRRTSTDRGFSSLSPDGGKMSSGSGYAPDSVGTTSRNSASTTSDIGSLSSNPEKQNRKAHKYKTQSSYDNGMMERPDPDDPETPFLIDEEPANGLVMQESGDDNVTQGEHAYLTNQPLDHLKEAPGSLDHIPQDSIAKCLNRTKRSGPSPPQSPNSNSPYMPNVTINPTLHFNDLPEPRGSRRHDQDSIAKCPNRTNNSGSAPYPSQSTSSNSSGPPSVPGGNGQGGTPIVVHNTYYGPVNQIQGGHNVIGNNATQINQHGTSGGNSTTNQPTTPRTMHPCTDDYRATYPSP